MINFTLKQLRYFEAVARQAHFGRAAETCAISQPALSAQIAALETAIGHQLFERGARQVRLTTFGEQFGIRARSILREAEALADRVAVITRGKILEVSTPAQLGGRATAKARVQWKSNGVIQEEMTDNPTEVVKRLSAQFPGEVPELQVLRPSLEDIYLSMIGEK